MRTFTLYVTDRVGTRQAVVDTYEKAEIVARANDTSTWTVTLPTDTDAGQMLATDTFARLEIAVRGEETPGYFLPGTPAIPAVDGYLTPAADNPAGGPTVYTDPRGRVWTLSAAGAITAKIPEVPAVPGVWVPPTGGDRPWRSGPVTHLQRTVDIDGDMLTASGVDDTIWLARRLAHPQPAAAAPPYDVTAYDVHTGPASTVLAELVRVNAGPSATAARIVPGLNVPVPAPAGPTVTVNARWQNLLSLCQETARGAGLIFDVVDLTFAVHTPAAAGVIFSAGLETLAEWTLEAAAPSANKIVVAGGGEGTARIIRELTDPDSIGSWGLAEEFQDRRDTTDLTQLDQAAADRLADAVTPVTVVFVPLETDGQAFGLDWNLGDSVTVIAGGLTVHDQIREIHVTLDANGATVIPSVGAPAGDLALFRSLAGLDRRVRQLERV